MTKIDIISGFLGAGKTTLIKKLLSEVFAGQQVVLIENEFGEIGIDGGFLKEAGIEIREMNSGCICCSLVGDFGASLKEVIEKYHPDRVLIEPSGVGKLSDVIKAVQGVQEEVDIQLNSYTTMVDVSKCKIYMKNFGEFFNNQIQCAGAIILSRTDKTPQDKVVKAVELIRQINDKSPVITTPITQLEGSKILDVMEHPQSLEEEMLEEEVCPVCQEHHVHEHDHHHAHGEECCGHDHHHGEECQGHGEHHHEEECQGHGHHHHGEECCGHDHHDHGDCSCGHDHHHHHADDVFTSWGKETVRTYSREEISGILTNLETEGIREDGSILRAKGMVAGTDGRWIYFDMVPGEHEICEGAPEFTGRICVIGSKLNEDKLEELFGLKI